MPVKGEFDDLEEKLFGVHSFFGSKITKSARAPASMESPGSLYRLAGLEVIFARLSCLRTALSVNVK